MIQRIQSVYLLLAAVSGLVLYFLPIAWFYGELNTIEWFVCRLNDHVPSNVAIFGKFFLLPLSIINLVNISLSVFTIFTFKKLSRQLQLVRLNIFLTFIYIAAVFFYYADTIGSKVLVSPQYSFGAFLPLISLVFLLLAMRGIQADIKLIKSVDRLR
ncbi:MAG: DUF4293 domain-containing protein [Bacteroidales bacterium]